MRMALHIGWKILSVDSGIPWQGQRDPHKWQLCDEGKARESAQISANESVGMGNRGSAFPGSLTHTATRWQQELSPNWGEVELLPLTHACPKK